MSPGPEGGAQSAPQTTAFFRSSPQDSRVLGARLLAPPLYDGSSAVRWRRGYGASDGVFRAQTHVHVAPRAGVSLTHHLPPGLLPSHRPPPRQPMRLLVKGAEHRGVRLSVTGDNTAGGSAVRRAGPRFQHHKPRPWT